MKAIVTVRLEIKNLPTIEEIAEYGFDNFRDHMIWLIEEEGLFGICEDVEDWSEAIIKVEAEEDSDEKSTIDMLPEVDDAIYYDEIFDEFYEHCAEWHDYPGWQNKGASGYRVVAPKIGDVVDFCHRSDDHRELKHRRLAISRLPEGLALDDKGVVIESGTLESQISQKRTGSA